MAEKNISLQLVFDENLKKNTNIPTTERLAFDDLGDFIEERNKIQRFLERRVDADLKVDYSDFSNHVFFDSAVQKVDIATQRILNKYPFNGTSEEKDAFHLTGSAYEKYFFEQWPREVAYTFFNGTNQYISASDVDSKLWIGTSSLYVSAWIKPVVTDQNMIVQYMSASTGPVLKHGYEFYLSGSTDPHLKFSIHSGSEVATVSASYEAFTASFNNVAAIYDKGTSLVNLFINNDLVSSASVSFGLIGTKAATKFYVGSGSQYTANSSSFDFYSGSLNEVRVLHTGSSLFHKKNYSRPIDAEEYVRLNYKFNEGITETGSIDSFVVDYSRNGIHGKFVNYSSGSRVSGSVMMSEPGDPILYNFHSRVVNFTGSLQLSASLYDLQNKNQIFNLIPEGVLIEDDLADGLLRNFSLAMARFFDEQKLYIDQFINLRTTNYEGVDETPDAFLPHLKRYFGWKVSEHFNNANPLEYLFGENIVSSGSLEVPLVDIRNQFWRRILNNLPLLMKSKGTRKNLDYLFNSLGLNKENIILKEYGYLPGTSIQDERVSKQKVQARLGFGTGSFTGSFLKSQDVIISDGPSTDFTVEAMLQLPFPSASYTGSLVTGSIWSFQDEVSCVNLYYVRTNQESQDGKFVLSSSEGSMLSSSNLSVFDGDFIHVAAGKDAASGNAFIKVREIEGNDIILSQDFTGSSTFLISSSDYYLVVGANSGSVYDRGTQGFFGEVRYWERELSGSEIDDHALNFQSVGLDNPYAETSPLKGHWALNEDNRTDASGILSGVVDLSRNGNPLIGEGFAASINPYDKFVHDYNYLSPAVDLKWTENKIRIRNKTELRPKDAANDTNEVSLEFSLIEALNEDIVKIFSTLDILNNLIGEPVFKYRDEYSDLEGVRRKYFERLSDNLNFSQFFNLFTWFDKKISDAIKQLLPTRVKFIGGEQVIESHLLERPRYRYQYPIFRTPQDPPEGEVDLKPTLSGSNFISHNVEIFPVKDLTSHKSFSAVSYFGDGTDSYYRNKVPTDPPHKFTIDINEDFHPDDNNPAGFVPYCIAVDSSGNLAVGGSVIDSSYNFDHAIYFSSSSGWETGSRGFSTTSEDSPHRVEDIYFDLSTDKALFVGKRNTSLTGYDISSASAGFSVSYQLRFGGVSTNSVTTCITRISSGTYFVGGYGDEKGDPEVNWIVLSSSSGDSSWGIVDEVAASGKILKDLFVSDEDHVFAVGSLDDGLGQYGIIRASFSGGIPSSFENVFDYNDEDFIPSYFEAGCKDSNNCLYVVGSLRSQGVVLKSQNGRDWSIYRLDPSVKNYNDVITASNKFEEYLILAGQQNNGDGYLQAIKISDGIDQHIPVDLSVFTSGSVWALASYNEKVYFVFSKNFVRPDEATNIPNIRSHEASTGSWGVISLPSESEERYNFFPTKVFGDSLYEINDPNLGVNFKNYFQKQAVLRKERDNE